MGKTVGELHGMLIEYAKGLPKKAETPRVMMIKDGKIQKSNKKSLKAKVLEVNVTKHVTPPDGAWTEFVSEGVTLLSISSTKHKERPLRLASSVGPRIQPCFLKILTVSTNGQTPLSQPTSVVRNTLGKEPVPQDPGRPISDEALREYCDRNYHQILPIIAEKVHQEKVQQEKLKAVKAHLNFEETSHHSE
ncbi:hypothetical protein Tco_1548565 [Tanacetum coccineum]